MADRSSSVIWSSDARADLSEIWDYHAMVAGPRTADKVAREIHEACLLLEQAPYGGRARDELRPGLRSIAVNPHVIFYRVTDDVAEIVRVLDGRRDLDEIFAQNG
jgi:toxin ParE1/3/4